ncbi:hypothetical protein H4I95_09752 [Botrytis cinerea]
MEDELGILSKSTHSKIGLNQDAGLRFLGWDDNAAAVARALQSRKKATALITAGFPISIKPCPRSGSVPFLLKTQKSLWGMAAPPATPPIAPPIAPPACPKKGIELIATGFPISIKPCPRSGSVSFLLLALYKVNISKPLQQLNPEIHNHTAAIAFIDLTPNEIHAPPYYSFDSQIVKFQQFGVWIQLGIEGGDESNTGFWIEESDAMSSVRTNTWSLNFDEDEVGGVVVEVTGGAAGGAIGEAAGGVVGGAIGEAAGGAAGGAIGGAAIPHRLFCVVQLPLQ